MRRPGALRVPELSAIFWMTKLVTTGTGETLSDYLVRTFDPPVVVLAAGVAFVLCFLVQFSARRYVPWRYWLFVTAVAVFGTMVADVLHVVVGIPYAVSTAGFAVALVAVMVVWRIVERTVDIHSVTTDRREFFYWTTVVVTFALGTAFGDLTATVLHLGYLGSAVVFLALIGIPPIAYRARLLGGVAAFWAAYVLTRPLGASLADWIAVPRWRGGLDAGTLLISGIGIALIGGCVLAMQRRSRRLAPVGAP